MSSEGDLPGASGSQDHLDDYRPQHTLDASSVDLYMKFIKEFSGDREKDQNIHSFIESIDEISISCGWPENITRWVLRSKLRGKAATFFEHNYAMLKTKPLAESKRMLISQFGRTPEVDYWRLLFDCKQQIGESVEEFFRRLIYLRDKCNTNGEIPGSSRIGSDKILSIFIDGLLRQIGEHMLAYTPTSLEEAFEMACKIEHRLRKMGSARSSVYLTEANHSEPDSDSDSSISNKFRKLRVTPGKTEVKGNREPSLSPVTVRRSDTRSSGHPLSNSPSWKEKRGVSFSSDLTVQSGGRHNPQVDGSRENTKRTVRNSSCSSKSTSTPKQYGSKHLVNISVNGHTIQCLIDPASDLTLIIDKVISKINLHKSIYRGESTQISGAIDGKTVSDRNIDLRFTMPFGHNLYIHTFKVLKENELAQYDAILGIDFLLPNGALLDYRAGELYLWGELAGNLTTTKQQTSSLSMIIAEIMYCRNSTQAPIKHPGKGRLPDGCAEDHGDVASIQSSSQIHSGKSNLPQMNFLKEIQEKTHVNGTELTRLLAICRPHGAVLDSGLPLGYIRNYVHTVELIDDTPIRRPQYQIPIGLRQDFKRKLDEYLTAGILERSNSPWNIPLIVKRKKSGDIRLILDASAVNTRTKRIDYPIVRIDETFTKLKHNKWFSSIDLRNGYHQVLLSKDSRCYFAFRTPFGKYQFKRMPMGAANSGIFFQKMMEELLKDLIGDHLIVYQDDLLIATSSVDEHLALISEILKIFEHEGIQINLDKSRLLVKEVTFLGHELHNGVFSPSSENLRAIHLLRPPSSKKQLRGFLGKINFYARFVPALAHIATPLTDLLSSKSRNLPWGHRESSAFSNIIDIICKAPILHYPDFSIPFVVSIQVSNTAIVGVLEQGEEDKRWPLGYCSKKLNKSQQNYSALEKSALAVITVLEYFHHIIYGYQVEVCTSRRAVEYLRGLKDGNSRISNWVSKAAKYAPILVSNLNSRAITHILTIDDSLSNDEDPSNKSSEIAVPVGPVAYTDGSCSGNGSSSATMGIGVHWENNYFPDYAGGVSGEQTNNKAELGAIIKALEIATEAGERKVTIISDSAYAINNIKDNIPKWCLNGWNSSKGRPVENAEEFKQIYSLCQLLDVLWVHTPGHSGNPGNETAHSLALQGRKTWESAEEKHPPLEELALKEASPISPSILFIGSGGKPGLLGDTPPVGDNFTVMETGASHSGSCETPEIVLALSVSTSDLSGDLPLDKDMDLVLTDVASQDAVVHFPLPMGDHDSDREIVAEYTSGEFSPSSLCCAQAMAIRTKPIDTALIVHEDEVLQAQSTDPSIITMHSQVNHAKERPNWEEGIRLYEHDNGGIYAKGRIILAPHRVISVNAIYVPVSLRGKVISAVHNSKWMIHSNFLNTCERITSHYFWDTIRSDVRRFIKHCDKCQRSSLPRKKPIVMDFPKSKVPGEKLAIDLIGPLHAAESGEKYILTITDVCSRYLVVCPLKNMTAEEVILALERHYITIFGVPRTILTDRGSNFRGKVFSQTCQLLGIEHVITGPYRPSTNGLVERLNKEVKKKLVHLCHNSGRAWRNKLHLVQFTHNNAIHSGLNTSPNMLMFGCNHDYPHGGKSRSGLMINDGAEEFVDDLRTRLELMRDLANEYEIGVRNKRNLHENKRRYIPSFEIGDLVLYRSVRRGKSRKSGFRYYYEGPFKILKKVSAVSYDIGDDSDRRIETTTKRAHAERLKLFYEPLYNFKGLFTNNTAQERDRFNGTQETENRTLAEVTSPELGDNVVSTSTEEGSEPLITDNHEIVPEIVPEEPSANPKTPRHSHAYYTRSKSPSRQAADSSLLCKRKCC